MSEAERGQLLQAIARTLSPLPEVQAALLFGSRAKGRPRAESDIDIAVLLDRTAAAEPAARRRLIGALARELAADRIDVVILNDAPPALAFQVLKHGAVAFERGRAPLHRFRVRTYSRHADFAHVERLFCEAVRRRALAETEHG